MVSMVQPFPEETSIQTFLTPQIAERSDIRQAEREAKQILIAYVGDGVATVFQGHAAAIPIVGGLPGCKLQLLDLSIESKAGSRAEPAPCERTVAQCHPELLELAGNLGAVFYGTALALTLRRKSRGSLGNLQKCVPAAEGERSEVVIDE